MFLCSKLKSFVAVGAAFLSVLVSTIGFSEVPKEQKAVHEQVSLCEMHLDRRLRDLGLGYQVDQGTAFSQEELRELRQLFDEAHRLKPKLRFQNRNNVATLVNPIPGGMAFVRLNREGEVKIVWRRFPYEENSVEQQTYTRILEVLIRRTYHMLASNGPDFVQKLSVWRSVETPSIRYLLKPGELGPGVEWHRDPDVFQVVVTLQAPSQMRGGSLEIERRGEDPGGRAFTFSKTFGAEFHNRIILFGAQSNWHQVSAFDLREMSPESPLQFRDIIGLAIGKSKKERVRSGYR